MHQFGIHLLSGEAARQEKILDCMWTPEETDHAAILYWTNILMHRSAKRSHPSYSEYHPFQPALSFSHRVFENLSI